MTLRERVTLGSVLVWRSLGVVAQTPRLLVYPILSWLSFVVSIGALAAVFTGQSFLPRLVGPSAELAYWLGIADVGVALLGGAVLTTLFNVALAHVAIRVLRDEDPRLRDGLYKAISNLDRVVVWGIVSSTVGPVAQVVERVDRSGTLVKTLLGGPWTAASFLVMPILAFEEPKLTRLFERGRQLYRKTWGYTAGASVGVDLVVGLVALPLVVVGAYSQFANLAQVTADLLGAVAVVGMLGLLLVRQIALGVSKSGLYIYATTNRTPKAFTGIDFSTVSWGHSATGEHVHEPAD